MEVLKQYPTNIEEWKHEDFEKFLGSTTRHMNYELGLSYPDMSDSSFYFNAKVRLTYIHEYNGIVFSGLTSTIFKLPIERDAPTIEFLFELVNKAAYEFAKIFHERKEKTNLLAHKIPIPVFSDLREVLQKSVDKWDAPAKEFKEEYGERIYRFKNLPELPEPKIYNNSAHTREQIISQKLFTGQNVTEAERSIFRDLALFYEALNKQLEYLDYRSFSSDEVRDFKNYMLYVFNFTVFVTNELTIYQVYRMIVNKDVTNENVTITDTKYLKYPPLAVVKKNGKYNRANTDKTTVFYAAENIDTALKEVRPPENTLVTVGVWKPKSERTFLSYPIVHNERAINRNPEVSEAFNTIQKQVLTDKDPLVIDYMHYYLKLLSNEYSKLVDHHYEYIISATFSEQIFKKDNGQPDFTYDCIIYPSVGNDLQTRNLAFRAEVVDEYFVLEKVIEFEVTEAFYDRTPVPNKPPEFISLANVKNYRETRDISPTGEIKWSSYIFKPLLESLT